MSEAKPTKAEADRTARLEREAAALRENLRRRKLQGAVKGKSKVGLCPNPPKA